MTESDDLALLRAYARENSEPAFQELVTRHVDLVYSAALRQTREPQLAEEVTQAVFILLAQKAGKISDQTILTGWLFKTTRFTALAQIRTDTKRSVRTATIAKELQMQTELSSEATNEVWNQMSPLLDTALAALGEKDRQAVLLRFFENKSLAEVGQLTGMGEDTARKRISRALEKLHRYFSKRGISSTTAIIAGTISNCSIQAAPMGLAKAVSTTAIAKGATASASTLTLIKGALKIMAWSKAKTAVVAGVVVLFAVETTTITVKEIQKHRTYPWQVKNVNSDILRKVPPQIGIAPAKYPNTIGAGSVGINDGQTPDSSKTMGIAVTLQYIISSAYGQSDERTVFLTKIPSGKFDYIANLPSRNQEALRKEIQRKFGLVGKRETRDTDVLLLKMQNPDATGLKSPNQQQLEPHSRSLSRSGAGYFTSRNQTLSALTRFLESHFKTPVINQTGLTNPYDIDLNWDENDFQHPNLDALKQALQNQLGLKLVPTNMPIEMLVVGKMK